jgi:L-gulonolactone oxidase
VHINHKKREAVVRAGTLLRDLNTVLRENGLALSSLPTLADQTIGGALAVGSHGTGLRYGNMATFVTSLSFVSGKGKLMTVNATANPELFKATLVSLGMMGVLTEVTFQCEEWFNLRENITIRSLDWCLQNLHHLSTRSDHGKLWIEAHSEVCAVFDVWRTQQPVTVEQPGVSYWYIKSRIAEPLLWLGSWLPDLNPLLLSYLFNGLRIFTPYERVAVSHEAFVPTVYVPANHQLELIVDMKDCSAALSEWRKLAVDKHVNLFTEVRYVKGDDIWLSPDYQRDTCHITVIIYNPSHHVMEWYFNSLYNASLRFSPRVHWAKHLCDLDSRTLHSLYPRLSDFARLRLEMDPHAIFVNDFLGKTFGFE